MQPTKEIYLAAADLLSKQRHLARQQWRDSFGCYDIGGAILHCAGLPITEYPIYDRLQLLKPLDNHKVFPDGWCTGFNDKPEATPEVAAAKLRIIAETIPFQWHLEGVVRNLDELLTIEV